jgi:hypothetical protein
LLLTKKAVSSGKGFRLKPEGRRGRTSAKNISHRARREHREKNIEFGFCILE